MQLIQKHIFIFFIVSFLKVKNILNEKEKLISCVNKTLHEFQILNEEDSNLLSLIDDSSVILKVFASGKIFDLLSFDQNINSDDSFYDNFSSFDNVVRQNSKISMTILPLTIYKGIDIIRKLNVFNNQQYFRIDGHVIVVLELNQNQRAVYNQKCYGDSYISQGESLNEIYLIKNQITSMLPDQLIIFGKLDEIGFKMLENRLVVQTNGILKWKLNIENSIWKKQGWSCWSEWDTCSKSCNGIQQRHRQYIIKNQKNPLSDINGHNIEQRDCNLFKCEDAINLLLFFNINGRNTFSKIKQFLPEEVLKSINKEHFTIMFTIRSKVDKKHSENISNKHLFTMQAKPKKYSSFNIVIINNEIRIVREKNFASEVFTIKSNLYDMKWHQFSISFRKDGLITCYIDCTWDRTVIMPKSSFDLPENPDLVEFNSDLINLIEWKQFTLISGNYASNQCSTKQIPIYDSKRIYDHALTD